MSCAAFAAVCLFSGTGSRSARACKYSPLDLALFDVAHLAAIALSEQVNLILPPLRFIACSASYQWMVTVLCICTQKTSPYQDAPATVQRIAFFSLKHPNSRQVACSTYGEMHKGLQTLCDQAQACMWLLNAYPSRMLCINVLQQGCHVHIW